MFLKLDEQICSLPNGLGLSREELPQVDKKDIPFFLEHLRSQNIKFFKRKLPVNLLIPSQKNLDYDKAKSLVSLGYNNLSNNEPIFISQDHFILDGHHRWFALKLLDKHAKMVVWEVELPVKELIQIMNSFQKSYNIGM